MTDDMNMKKIEENDIKEEIYAENEAETPPAASHKDEKKKQRQLESENLDLKKQLEQSAADFAALNDKYLRLAAEYDNFRKRTAKERDDLYNDAYGEALTALFPVIDNLERAAQYTDGESVAKGVAMVLKSIQETLAKLDVTEVETKTFDPNLHNAVLHVEDAAYGEGEIVEVLQKGYRRGDRVLRYAMVKVAN